jgi:hypothetical protein
MSAVSDAIFDRLMSSGDLVALLAGFANGKAIFTQTPIPPGVVPPFIVVPEPVDDMAGAFDTKNSSGREWTRDIGCYMRATGDSSAVDAMAEIVRALFHRKAGEINIAGYGVMVAKASGPIQAPTDNTIYGRIVRVTLAAAA